MAKKSTIEQAKARIQELRKQLTEPVPQNILKEENLLSTGSSLLNLASTGFAAGGFIKGKYHLVVGDTASGKTFLGLTCLAEACRNEQFADYRLIHDDVEGGALMSIRKFFGKALAERIEPPARDKNGESLSSDTVEGFYYNLDDAFKQGRPFIYILDSMDALTSDAEEEKFLKKKEAARKGQVTTGTMTDNKAKINSTHLRLAQKKLRESGSILIIVNQTRDNLGFGFETKTRSGGRALTFYATTEVWSAKVKTLTKTVQGVKRDIGILSQIKVKKNRGTGKLQTVEFPIYHSYGIDDIGSCIDYLIEEKHWKQRGQKIQAPEFKVTASRDRLVKHIEDKGLEKRLASVVEKVWKKVEEACRVNRKKRFE